MSCTSDSTYKEEEETEETEEAEVEDVISSRNSHEAS